MPVTVFCISAVSTAKQVNVTFRILDLVFISAAVRKFTEFLDLNEKSV